MLMLTQYERRREAWDTDRTPSLPRTLQERYPEIFAELERDQRARELAQAQARERARRKRRTRTKQP